MALQNNVVILLTVIIVSSIWNKTEGHVDVPGDVKIIGLFKVHELIDGKCTGDVDVTSVMLVEAIKWYIEQLNDKGGLPLKIGFEAFETCGKMGIAAEHAVRIMNRAVGGERIIGVIGPEYSSEAEAISPTLNAVSEENRMPLVGFSTTAARLTDVNRFSNFVRVVPNDDLQVELMIQSMVKMEWSRIAIVYEDDIYGQDMESALKMKAKQVGICIAMSRKISVSNGINLNEVDNITRAILDGTPHISPISGFVFIGSERSAKEFILYMTKQNIATLPIVMFSEGSNLDKGIFATNDGSALTKALGNFLLSPEYHEVKEFTSYWKSIFSNSSVFEVENGTNPWLSEVYYILKNGCKTICEFITLSDNVLNKKFGQQPLYLKYAILAAHVLIKGATLLQNQKCINTNGLCRELQTNFEPGDVLKLISGMQIKMDRDFRWRPESIRHQGTITISNITGDSMVSSEVPSYQLFNVQKNTDIVFTNVGNLSAEAVSVNSNEIRDYNVQGHELTWPNVRKAQCLEGLVEEIKKVKLDLDGTGTKMRVFDNNGDGNIGYRIYNIQKDPDNSQSLIYREIGRSPLDGTFTFEKDKIVYPTAELFTSTCPNEQACSQCLTNLTAEKFGLHDENTSDEDGKTIVIILGVCLSVFGLATVGLALKLFWIFRKTRENDRDMYLSPNSIGNTGTSLNREEVTQSRIYMDIQPCTQEERFVRE